MATIKDIARAVGVSPTTVSNVIHGNARRVSAETIARINDAIAAMHYVPNMSARSLVSHASHIIGVINNASPASGSMYYQDPFRGALLTGIESELDVRGYYLMVRTVADRRQLVSLLANWNLDGLIIASQFEDEFYADLARDKTPFLLVDAYLDNPDIMQVQLEDRRGGFLATEHLIKHGHSRILFIAPNLDYTRGVMRERFNGYRDALSAYHLPFDPANVYECGTGVDASCKLSQALAARTDYTGIFAATDMLAAGLISGLSQARRHIPDDISIVGYDDLSIARLTNPLLTTVHQDVIRKGQLAASMLVDAVEQTDAPTSKFKCVVLPVELIERSSVRNLDTDR